MVSKSAHAKKKRNSTLHLAIDHILSTVYENQLESLFQSWY